MECGTGHYKHLMAQFNTVVEVFLDLDEQYQDVIADITRRMGEGMADFIQREVCPAAELHVAAQSSSPDGCHTGCGLSSVWVTQRGWNPAD